MSTASTAHTPTPWYVVDNGSYHEIVVPNDEGKVNQYCPSVVSVITYDHADDAAFIVRACNSHEQLVAALEACYAALHPNSAEGEAARAALAAAGA